MMKFKQVYFVGVIGRCFFIQPRLCAPRLCLLPAVKLLHKSHTKHLVFTYAYFCERYLSNSGNLISSIWDVNFFVKSFNTVIIASFCEIYV